MWQEELADFAAVKAEIVDAARYRQLEARTGAEDNPWEAIDTALTTIDFLKRDDRFGALLGVPWDLVIMDEAHQASDGSQSGQVLRALWTADSVDLMVAASATPGRLLDRLLHSPGGTVRVLRRHRGDLLDWSDRPIFRPLVQEVEICEVRVSAEERHLFETTRALLQESVIGKPNRRLPASLFVRRGHEFSLLL